MQRITDKDLKTLCERLNTMMGTPQFKANIGNYHIDSAYGGVQLVQVVNESGGIRQVIYSGHVTRRELYSLIHAYIKGLEDSKENNRV